MQILEEFQALQKRVSLLSNRQYIDKLPFVSKDPSSSNSSKLIDLSVYKTHTKKQIELSKAIVRVLTTPLGSRVMRPMFGSRLYELIDRSIDSSFMLDAISWTYEAIEKNLKEVKIDSVEVKPISSGIFKIVVWFNSGESIAVRFE